LADGDDDRDLGGLEVKTVLSGAADGIWNVIYRPPPSVGSPALFLDRDGVLVDEVGYLHRPGDVRLLSGAAELVRAANRAGVVVVVVTNQAGIGRGYYDWADFEAVRHRIDELLARERVQLDAVYACPFHPAALAPYRHAAHPGRKPGSGMLLRAASDLGIDLSTSWIVGDVVEDLEAGRSAGLAGAVHVRSGHGDRDRERVAGGSWAGFDIRYADDPGDVVNQIPILAIRA
jgi:D-glycero-D-manno-heptose 1,7-bisphosphate phosphatase